MRARKRDSSYSTVKFCPILRGESRWHANGHAVRMDVCDTAVVRKKNAEHGLKVVDVVPLV